MVGQGYASGHDFGFSLGVQWSPVRFGIAVRVHRLIVRFVVLVAGTHGMKKFMGNDDIIALCQGPSGIGVDHTDHTLLNTQ